MKNSEEMNRAVEMYADMVRRICLVHLKNKHDMEDVFQNVFLKYKYAYLSTPVGTGCAACPAEDGSRWNLCWRRAMHRTMPPGR